MSCSACCYSNEDCPDCGQCLCDCNCDYDGPCQFCGDLDCDGTGYNCSDGHYQEYNLRGYETTAQEDAYMAEHHPTAMLTVGPPEHPRTATRRTDR